MSRKTIILYQELSSLHGYFLKNNLLYHHAKLLEQIVERLVVPRDRRKNILDLAHNLVGGHVGIRCTKDRIALSFMWPNLTNDVTDYCRTCEICQRRARITCYIYNFIRHSMTAKKKKTDNKQETETRLNRNSHINISNHSDHVSRSLRLNYIQNINIHEFCQKFLSTTHN